MTFAVRDNIVDFDRKIKISIVDFARMYDELRASQSCIINKGNHF